MSNGETSGKGPERKLGRGLSALFGAPVPVQTGAKDPASPKSAAADRTGFTSGSMQEIATPTAQTPTAPVEVKATVPTKARQEATVPKGAAAKPTDPAADSGSGLRSIPVEQIIPNRRQPRTDFDPAALESLAASIRQAGLMQPVMVRPTATGYELVAGERRWRAAKLIGLSMIPAVVREIDEQTSAELALIENVQREDLNPMDRAIALSRLASDFGLTHQAIAERVGLDRASVTNLLRLSELDPASAEFVRRGKISQGHAKALLSVADLRRRIELAQRTSAEGWSVRDLERRVQQLNNVNPSVAKSSDTDSASTRSANVADLERRLSEHLGTRVTINLGRKKGSGRLVVNFFSLDQFDGLMQRFGFNSSR